MFESSFAAMDQMIGMARRQIAAHTGPPEEYLSDLAGAFVAEAKQQPLGAGAVNMAVSVFLLARQQEVIERLVEDLRMRDDALKMLFDLDEM